MSADSKSVIPRAPKVPPHSQEAEQAVLGALMIDHRAWDRVSDRLIDKDFYRRNHQIIYQAMQELAAQSQPFDVLTVAETLKMRQQLEAAGGEGYLFELAQNTPTAANVAAYADIVRERAILRQLISVGTDLVEKAYQVSGQESKDLLDAAEQKVFQIAEQHSRDSGPIDIGTLLARTTDRLDELYRSGSSLTGVSSGFTDLDHMTAGLQKGDLIIIAGRPSMGKTSFAMNIAENVAIKSKLPVLIFSMEMPAESLTMRMLSSLSRVDLGKVLTGKLSDQDWPRISTAVQLLAETRLYIDDTAGLTPSDVRSRARRIAREHNGLGLVVVDYLQLMRVPGNKENRTNEISEISRSLKILAKELSVPVIALSQLNRGLEQRSDRRPVMSDLRECVPGNTLVMLADGRRVPIAELVGKTPEVLSLGPNRKITAARSDKVWCVGKKPIFTVHLASGRKVQGTAEHRLLGAEDWVAIRDLKIGDRLAIARQLPEPMGSTQELRISTQEQPISQRKIANVRSVTSSGAAHFSLPSSRKPLVEYTKLINDDVLPTHCNGDLCWDRVVAIEPAGEADVYDLTVPETASWLADGVVSHNSGAIEQDADLIAFIYRDEVYDENSKDKGIAEIIIRKQRNGPIGDFRVTFLGNLTKFENYAGMENLAEGFV